MSHTAFAKQRVKRTVDLTLMSFTFQAIAQKLSQEARGGRNPAYHEAVDDSSHFFVAAPATTMNPDAPLAQQTDPHLSAPGLPLVVHNRVYLYSHHHARDLSHNRGSSPPSQQTEAPEERGDEHVQSSTMKDIDAPYSFCGVLFPPPVLPLHRWVSFQPGSGTIGVEKRYIPLSDYVSSVTGRQSAASSPTQPSPPPLRPSVLLVANAHRLAYGWYWPVVQQQQQGQHEHLLSWGSADKTESAKDIKPGTPTLALPQIPSTFGSSAPLLSWAIEPKCFYATGQDQPEEEGRTPRACLAAGYSASDCEKFWTAFSSDLEHVLQTAGSPCPSTRCLSADASHEVASLTGWYRSQSDVWDALCAHRPPSDRDPHLDWVKLPSTHHLRNARLFEDKPLDYLLRQMQYGLLQLY